MHNTTAWLQYGVLSIDGLFFNVWLLSLLRDSEESKQSKEKHDGKEKSSTSKRGNRYHPYKEKHGGEKKSAHRNRVFISNIPYDMKWQAIKDLMRDKGNVPRDGGGVFPSIIWSD